MPTGSVSIRYEKIREVFEEALSEKIGYKLNQFIDGTVMVNPRFFKEIFNGNAYSVSHRFPGVASGASVDLYFENPSGSGVTVYIIVIEVISFAQAWIDIYHGNTVSSSGTQLTPVNLNLGSNNTSRVRVEYDGTYSPGTLAVNTVCPGGSLIRAVGGVVEVGETIIIPENNNILVRVTNQSGSAADLSIRIIWWEQQQ